MLYRFKSYLILAAIVLIALVLVMNKLLVYGIIVFAVGTVAVGAYHLFVKQKDDEIHQLKMQLKDSDKTPAL